MILQREILLFGKRLFAILFLVFLTANILNADTIFKKKKVLFINSYHTGYDWSDRIEKSVKQTLRNSALPIQFKRIQMDSKRNDKESYKLKVALRVKDIINSFNPDIVITSDDNAVKYVIVPYFKNSDIPFIFTGINVSAQKYGFPTKNVTGMLEVPLINQIHKNLKTYAKGDKVGFIKGESFSSRVEAKFFEKRIGQKIDKRFVTTVEEWKENYLDLQKKVDMILIGSIGAVKGWDENSEYMESFIKQNTKIPTGSWSPSAKNKAMFVYSIVPEEAGIWAADNAISILNGKRISTIPIVENQNVAVFINTTIAKKLNVVFPFDIIDNAELIK